MTSTKEKLLAKASELFAKYGPDGVSTRDIAKEAKVNLCSINYYFGSKQKLYDAAIQNLSLFIKQNFIDKALDKTVSPLSPREELKFILSQFLYFLCDDKTQNAKVELLLKELVHPSEAYTYFYTEVFEPMHKHFAKLISQDLGIADTDLKVILLTHSLFGQAVMFRIHRESLFRRLGIQKYTPELVQAIQKTLAQNCDAVLDAAKEDK